MNLPVLEYLISCGKFKYESYEAQQVICKANEYQSSVYLIKKGIVKLSQFSKNGEEIIPVLLTDPMIFGADIISENDNVTFSSEALTYSEVCIFCMKDITEAILDNPKFSKDLLRLFKDKYFEIENRIRILKLRSAEQRLMEAILEFSLKFGQEYEENNNFIKITIPIDQDSLGKYIRVTRETICLLIQNLKDEGIISYSKNTIIISKSNLIKLREKPLTTQKKNIAQLIST